MCLLWWPLGELVFALAATGLTCVFALAATGRFCVFALVAI